MAKLAEEVLRGSRHLNEPIRVIRPPGGRRAPYPSAVALVVLAVAVVTYGNVLAFRAVRTPVVVGVNLAVAAGLVVLARAKGVSWHALGLDAEALSSGLLWGGVTALAISLAAGIIQATPLRKAFRDLRTVDMRPPTMAFHYLVRIPFGTALFEEVVFRGVLLALLARQGFDLGAVLLSSAAFGLWHVGASLDFLRANNPGADAGAKALAIVSGVALTTAGGILFATLRIAAESLLAPILAHAAFNVAGLSLARSEPRWADDLPAP
jgi:membrane protease YdiL (CAAX protease family)